LQLGELINERTMFVGNFKKRLVRRFAERVFTLAISKVTP